MATAIQQNIKVVKLPEKNTFVAGTAYIMAPVEAYDPPRPIDARGSLGNSELREIAKGKVPPQSWFEGDEEQVF